MPLAVTPDSLAKLERQAIYLQTAAQVSHAASSILDLDELLPQAVNLIRHQFGFYYVGLFLLEAGEWAVLRAGTDEAGRRMIEQGHRLKVGDDSMIGWCIAHQQARIALDVGQDAVHFDNPFLPDTRSEMALPLISRGRVIGAMTFQSREVAAFSEEDAFALQSMADQLANAIENARLFAETQARTRELAVLNDLGRALSMQLDVEAALYNLYRYVSQVMDATNFYVALYDPERDEVSFPLAVEDKQQRQWAARRRGKGLTEYVLRTQTPLLIAEDVRAYMQQHLEQTEHIGREAQSWLGVPMTIGDQVVGVVAVQSYETPRLYNERHRDLLSAMATQAAIAVENARLLARQQQSAQRAQALYETSRALSSRLEEGALMRAILEAVYQTLQCEHVIISLLDESARTIGIRYGIWQGEFDVFPEWVQMAQYPLDHPDIIADVYRTGRTEIITGWDERFNRQVWEQFGHERFLRVFMPIKLQEQVLGVIEVAYDKQGKGSVSDDEVQLLAAFMDQAAVALQNARLLAQTQAALAETEALYRATQAITGVLDLEALVERLAEVACQLTNARYSVVLTLDPATGRPQHFKPFGIEPEWQPPEAVLPQGRGVLGLILSGQIVRADDVREHPSAVGTPDWHFPVRAVLGVPLLYRGEKRGLMLVGDPSAERTFSATDERILSTYATQAAIAIENQRLFQQTQAALAEQERLLAETEALYRASQAITAAQDVNHIYTALLQYGQGLAADRCLVAVIDDVAAPPAERQVEVKAVWDRQGRENAFLGNRFTPAHIPLIGRVGLADVVVVDDFETAPHIDERTRATFKFLGVGAAAIVPLAAGGRLLGWLLAETVGRPRTFGEREVNGLLSIASQAAVAIQNLRRLEAIQARAEREQLTRTITDRVRRATDREAIMRVALQELSRALGTSQAVVRLGTAAKLLSDREVVDDPGATHLIQ